MDRIFIDMDGVMAHFDEGMAKAGLPASAFKLRAGAYRDLPPFPGAIEAVRALIADGWDVWVATKPPTENVGSASEKVAWIHEHLPELKTKIIITFDKGLLGDEGDFLVDDRPHKANCEAFRGELLHFGAPGRAADWAAVLGHFAGIFPRHGRRRVPAPRP